MLVRFVRPVQNPVPSMLEENSTFAGRYRILRRIASGGMGAVYEARHLETDRACALKVMLAHVAENASARERFRLEARAAALVTSAHVVEVLDAGVDETTGSPFLVMELLSGEDLGSRVGRLGPLAPEEVAPIVWQAARGLDALHNASIVHRDLKPSNLFLARRDGHEIVKVLDLGVAKRVADTAATTAVVGTPLYMAPEQMSNGKITPATDEYALAMVAYSLLVGREYWTPEAEAATSSTAFALVALDGPKEPATERAATVGVTLPAAFDEWFVRATAPDPHARFPNVLDAAIALGEAFGIDSSDLRAEGKATSLPSKSVTSRAPIFDAFAPTLPGDAPAKSLGKTATLADEESSKNALKMNTVAETQRADRPQRSKWRKATLGGAALLVSAFVAFAFVRDKGEKISTPPPVIRALGCAAAEISGPGASPQLADALGKGACARLGVELGVGWLDPQGTRLTVHAELHEDRSAHVRLELSGQTAVGNGKTLIGATNAAISNLAPTLQVPPMSPERIAGWGARDEASARRIERALRQQAFRFADRAEVAKKLVASDNDSPMAHAMLACASRHEDSALAQAEKKEALARLSVLPAKRAQIIQSNLFDFIPSADDPKTFPSIAENYVELAEEADFTSLYTMCGCVWSDTSLPIVDWLAKHAPITGLPIIPCIMRIGVAKKEQWDHYVHWMGDVLPEWQGTYIDGFLELEQFDDARKALDVLDLLGNEMTKHADIVRSKMLLAFASLEPEKAFAAAEELMGEPHLEVSHDGAVKRIDALLFAGKIRAAMAAAEMEMHLLTRASQNTLLLTLTADQLQLRRLLGRPALSTGWLESIQPAMANALIYTTGEVEVELALLGDREAAKKTTVHSNAVLEKISTSKLLRDDYKGAYTLPAVRVVRGDDAVAAMYREIQYIPARQRVAFEAALAFEAIGAKTEAEDAYRLCTKAPWDYPFNAIAARLRLAEMARADGREEDARALLAIVDRVWAKADPDLRDIVRQMK